MVRRVVQCIVCQRRFIAQLARIDSCVSACVTCETKATAQAEGSGSRPSVLYDESKKDTSDDQTQANPGIRFKKVDNCTAFDSTSTLFATIPSDPAKDSPLNDILYLSDGEADLGDPCHNNDNDDDHVDDDDDGDDDDHDDLPLAALLSARQNIDSPRTEQSKSCLVQCAQKKSSNVIANLSVDDAHLPPIVNLPKSCNQGKDNENLKECNVCGSSLLHIASWNGRLNHLKRCSQQHGVTAHQMQEEEEVIAEQENFPPPAEKPCPQPPKSINQLLMAGARRKAIQDKHKAEATKKLRRGAGDGHGGGGGGGGGWNRQRTPTGNCPNYKKIPGTDFVVDGFYYAKPSLTSNYFLTHFHADHYGGLTKSWSAGIIYCSAATANLVEQQLGVQRQFLHVLPMNQTSTLETRSGRKVKVSLIDANHCPGAVLLFFQIGEQTILHVGDFRWDRKSHLVSIHSLLQGRRLDQIYLDTTYCDPKYTLPTQKDAIAATVKYAVARVEEAKQNRQRLLLLFGAYTIGKERIYLAVAKALRMKVYVDSRRYRILRALEWPEEDMAVFTTKSNETTLWVVPLGHISMKKLPSYTSAQIGRQQQHFDRVIGFRPTGWSLKGSKSKKGNAAAVTDDENLLTICTRGSVTACSVPYSEHSAFPELVDCLACLQPRIIVPTVSVRKSQEQINVLLAHLEKH